MTHNGRICGTRRTAYYLVASRSALPRLENLVGNDKLNVVAESGGKLVLTNLP